ncbi:MAG: hydrogenase expression/formation protein HypE [Sedimentisphaerales bacterium]|nr:hydrogenase expression/formation protein HypE [Sedimentisphaerales bacterium]
MTDKIMLAHGGGGTLMQELINKDIVPAVADGSLFELTDSALLDLPGGRVAFTTDSFVVRPLVFPGGDIGRLAVCGTVNDLAAAGALPVALALGLIIEEGLDMEVLRTMLTSIGSAAREAGVKVVTGDTKVVEKGAANELFINTSGVGVLTGTIEYSVSRIAPGDSVIINGFIGDHGIAVMSARNELNFVSPVESDAAPLGDMVQTILREFGDKVKCMKDPTRGGLAGCLNEMAQNVGFFVDQDSIPLRPAVKGACQMLGLDELTVANEGKMVFIVDSSAEKEVLALLQRHPFGKDAAIIGHIDKRAGLVRMQTALGGERIINPPYGEELPRIC